MSERKSQEFWQDKIRQWKISGKSQRKFCEKNGLKVNTFLNWKKKINTLPKLTNPSTKLRTGSKGRFHAKNQGSKRFIELKTPEIKQNSADLFQFSISENFGLEFKFKISEELLNSMRSKS